MDNKMITEKTKRFLPEEVKIKISETVRKKQIDPNYTRPTNKCLNCEKETLNNKFCSKRCSALINNKQRKQTEESRHKASQSLSNYHKIKNANKPPKEIKKAYRRAFKKGPNSKLYYLTCKSCKTLTITKKFNRKRYCDLCISDHSNLRFHYRFRFNVYHFPDLFDLDLLNSVGWYSPRGKSGKWNPHGLSRDHKVSVSDAIKYKYDEFYITHPLNCELMPHSKNAKKKHNSSLTFEELKVIVDEYESRKAS